MPPVVANALDFFILDHLLLDEHSFLLDKARVVYKAESFVAGHFHALVELDEFPLARAGFVFDESSRGCQYLDLPLLGQIWLQNAHFFGQSAVGNVLNRQITLNRSKEH